LAHRVVEFLGKQHIVDAYIIFLLAAQASMIFPTLNWWPHPVRWFRSLVSIDKFTFAVAVFTALLVLVTCVQVLAFIRSERASLVVPTPQFIGGFGANKDLMLLVDIKNGGKSTAFIDDFKLAVKFVAPKDSLPTEPEYPKADEMAPGPILSGAVAKIYDIIHGVHGEPHLIITPSDVERINSGMLKLYIIGFVAYTDEFTIFGDRQTGFCYRYEPSVPGNFVNCTECAYTYSR
jgi:hypothetical protein